jgi:hypothetical protein
MISVDIDSVTLLQERVSVASASLSQTTINPRTGAAHPRQLPVSVPRAQLYYWSRLWQRGEERALRDLQAGRSRRFDDPTDAVRWLLSEDD